MSSKVITADALRVAKGSNSVLDSLSFSVKSGTITGLIGPSGSGKTTLMRAIVGTQTYQGKLSVFGYPAGAKKLRSKIGYVTQSPAVYGDLTVMQNLEYFMSILQANKEQVVEVIELVDLTNKRDTLVANLSGGQKARVSLAVALLGKPELLVLDEPTVGLDPILREHLWSLFEKLVDQGTTILVSSHVMDEAERCEDILLMRDGKMLWHDSRLSLLSKTHTKSVNEAFITMAGGK